MNSLFFLAALPSLPDAGIPPHALIWGAGIALGVFLALEAFLARKGASPKSGAADKTGKRS